MEGLRDFDSSVKQDAQANTNNSFSLSKYKQRHVGNSFSINQKDSKGPIKSNVKSNEDTLEKQRTGTVDNYSPKNGTPINSNYFRLFLSI